MTNNLLASTPGNSISADNESRQIGGPNGFTAQSAMGGVLGRFLLDEIARDFESARLSKAFRAFYRVRPFLPTRARRLLQRLRNASKATADDWYLPTRLLDAIERFGAPDSIWPDSASYAFVLTHDVETQSGMSRMPQVAEIEESFGFRSSWNLVPYKYEIDHGLVADLVERGFEIGIHGYNHDGRTFFSEQRFRQRLPRINEAIREFNAAGFRAPMVHRDLSWMQDLEIDYDASCFDVDPFQAIPGGIQSFWPSLCGRFVELPYTLPQDHTLFVTLGETSDRIWRDKLSKIIDCRGMALMLTHPDYLDSPARIELYRDFLAHIKESGQYWHALPRNVSRFVRSAFFSSE